MQQVSLTNEFKNRFGIAPQYIAHAPGRVNLIGEHIDYMGYGVLPFALEQQCRIAFSIVDEAINIQHIDSTIQSSSIDEPHGYMKFVRAGYQAGFNGTNVGIKALVSGDVPLSSGLSSSSALVVASALMTQQTQKEIHQNLIDRIIDFERQAGTACGGMDQTVSLFAREGKALYIEFDPIKYHEVQLPKGYTFVIANSMTPSTKLETLGQRYNKRVCECRLGIRLVERKLNTNTQFKSLKALQQHLGKSFDDMEQLIRTLPPGEIPIQDIDLDLKALFADIQAHEIVLAENKTLNPHDRLLHVILEAHRVIKFKETCDQSGDIGILGDLMNQSQSSCKQLYECSSENIDKLTDLAIQAGALGSRLTGAGWGGCTVSLIKQEDAKQFINAIVQQFYQGVYDRNVIFESKPSQGAYVETLKN